jgi:hypothetical protein
METKAKIQTGIWIDGKKAIVIALNGDKETILEIESDIENAVHHDQHEGDKGSFMGNRHINNEKKIGERKKHQTDHFLDKVLAEIKGADELFLMGPAELKIKLKGRIEVDSHLSPRLKGVTSTDHLTLNQCVEKVKKFYLF